MKVRSTVLATALALGLSLGASAASTTLQQAEKIPTVKLGECDGGKTTVTGKTGETIRVTTAAAANGQRYNIVHTQDGNTAYVEQDSAGNETVLSDRDAFLKATAIGAPQFAQSLVLGISSTDCKKTPR